jgi:transposase
MLWTAPPLARERQGVGALAFFQKLPPCLVGIEACASSNHWSRELQALGHTVRPMPPAYVKPYVKRQKNFACGWPQGLPCFIYAL